MKSRQELEEYVRGIAENHPNLKVGDDIRSSDAHLAEATRIWVANKARTLAKLIEEKGLDSLFNSEDNTPINSPAIELGIKKGDEVLQQMNGVEEFVNRVLETLEYEPIPTIEMVGKAEGDREALSMLLCERGENQMFDSGLPKFLPSVRAEQRLGKQTINQQMDTKGKDATNLGEKGKVEKLESYRG